MRLDVAQKPERNVPQRGVWIVIDRILVRKEAHTIGLEMTHQAFLGQAQHLRGLPNQVLVDLARLLPL